MRTKERPLGPPALILGPLCRSRRSNAVGRYLEAHGIPSSQLIARGFGKTIFVAPNDTDERRVQNRRVEQNPVSSQ